GEFNDLSQFKTAGEKRSCNLKNFSFEKNYIATEFELNPCSKLSDISEKMKEKNRNGSYSRPTICRIAKKMGYTRKFLTLVPLNRNSNDNKNVRAQYTSSLVSINKRQKIFIDETGFYLHSTKKNGVFAKKIQCVL
ncbi:hypothetical protein DMUE_5753, partial [Dictyocoela muelleri]